MFRRGLLLLSAAALFLAGNAFAATPGVSPDVPTPYLPSTRVAVDEMLRLAGTGPDDLVVDLGSGDGRVVIAAAHDFDFGDWRPDRKTGIRKNVYLWIVPAPVWEMTLAGDRLSFVVVNTTDRDDEAGLYFAGRVAGDVIEGELTRGVGAARSVARWRAARTGR